MGAMYRLKAYFGMVPADELGDYVDDPEPQYREPTYPLQRRSERWEERRAEEPVAQPPADEPPPERWERRVPEQTRSAPSVRPVDTRPAARASGLGASVHGALAVDRALERTSTPAPSEPEPPRADPPRPAPPRITTLQPRSYNEARTIGEHYRDGIPVIMNLTELDDAAAKRLVDFAAGLAFALRGSIDKVTSRVFLLTPPEVEVSADDARQMAERGRLFGDR